jgi:hypothetical protein
MLDGIKLLIYRSPDWGRPPQLIIQVTSWDGMNESETISELDMLRECSDVAEKSMFIRKAVIDLAKRTLLPSKGLLEMAVVGDNAAAVRSFVYPQPKLVRKTEPVPEPELQTGWMGFLSGVAEAIMEAHKNYVLPKARVVKGGKV